MKPRGNDAHPKREPPENTKRINQRERTLTTMQEQHRLAHGGNDQAAEYDSGDEP